jgi:hypothetical protein
MGHASEELFDFQWRQEVYLFSKVPRAALGPPSLLLNEYQRLFPRGKAAGA